MEGANNEGDQSKGLIYEHNAAYVREARPDSCLLEEVLLLFRGTKAMVNIETEAINMFFDVVIFMIPRFKIQLLIEP